jgi:cytochrome c553
LLAIGVAAASLLSLGAASAFANDFEEKLARVDEALKKNPERVSHHALNSCLRQRNHALRLFDSNQTARAERSLKYCFQVLEISEQGPRRGKEGAGPSMAEVQAKASREVEQALGLTPNIQRGLEIYRGCADCHKPEGWGMSSGLVPQLAGQRRTVVIKQLADIRAGNRESVLMAPYASVEVIGGAQAVADVAGYIDTLEISTAGGKGAGDDLELGERLYRENCARCHGATGEGDVDAFVPRIQAQHFNYLVRQFQWIRDGKRRNANAEMKAQIDSFEERDTHAVLDYVSRLEPPPELQAPPGWKNPDFPE